MKEKVNQHYVPQFYLKNFANDEKKRSVAGYALKTKTPICNIAIDETASKKYYYGDDLRVENWFAEMEGKWAQIVQNIISRKSFPINKDDYWMLVYFVAISSVRVLKYGNVINKMINGVMEHGHRFGQVASPHTVSGHPISYMDSHLLKNYDIYEKLKPLLLYNRTNQGFLTSDNPCVMYNQFFVSQNLPFYSIRHGGVQLFMPISPCFCLCFYDGAAYKAISSTKGKVVKIAETAKITELNKLFLRNADMMVYYKQKTICDTVINTLIGEHKFYQHEPIVKSLIPIVGIKMESINDSFDIGLFNVRKSFIKR